MVSYFPSSVNSMFRARNKILYLFMPFIELELPFKPKNLPLNLSFLRINNPNIQLSALKKAENGEHLIIRLINMAYKSEKARITFYPTIKNIKILNLLEEQPINEIKAKVFQLDSNHIEVELSSHVLATLKVELTK